MATSGRKRGFIAAIIALIVAPLTTIGSEAAGQLPKLALGLVTKSVGDANKKIKFEVTTKPFFRAEGIKFDTGKLDFSFKPPK